VIDLKRQTNFASETKRRSVDMIELANCSKKKDFRKQNDVLGRHLECSTTSN